MSQSKRLAISGLITAVVFFFIPWPALGDNPCALLLGGYRDDCIIITANKAPIKPKTMMCLYSGDKIIQKSGVNEIVIKCSPFTSVKKIDKTSLQIIYQPPSEKRTVLKELKAFLGFEKDSHQSRTAGTRAIIGEGSDSFVPQPGYRATVMPGEAIQFSSDREGIKTIVFKDSSGFEVFSKAFGEKTSIELTPQEISMRPSETYYWQIEILGALKSNEMYPLKLLENDMIDLVTSDLKKIALAKLGDAGKKIRMAAYCQFVSDTYPKDVDLYWKSYQLLKELDITGLMAEENNLAQLLRDRCIQHIEEQMATGYR